MSALERFGRYENLRPLADNVSSQVFLAYDPVRQEDVVLKLMLREADRELLDAQRLGTELQKLLAARCPQVPTVLDSGDQDGYAYVTLQLIPGRDLSSVVQAEGRVEIKIALRWLLQLCDILKISHELRGEVRGEPIAAIVHSDIKLENLRLTRDGRIFLIDFGTAKGLSTPTSAIESNYATPPNTPPEYEESGRKVNVHTDLWAAGVVLYRLVCGHSPFVEPSTTLPDDERDRQIFEAIRLAMLRPVPPSCPPTVERILRRALAHQASQRYPSAAAFPADLDACLYERPLARKTRELRIRRNPSEKTRRTAPPGPRRRWPLWGIIGAVLVLLTASQIAARALAGRFEKEISTKAEPDLELAGRWLMMANRLSLLPLTAQNRQLHAALLREADFLFTEYRENQRVVRCSEWQRIQGRVDRAVRIEPQDHATKARQLYVHGQVKRLAARKNCKGATATFPEAVKLLEQAAELDPSWPDPYLPLIDIHALRDFDYERLMQAYEAAQARGYQTTERDKFVLATGLKIRCRQLRQDAQQMDEVASRRTRLEEAKESCADSKRWFAEIPRLTGVREGLGEVNRDLAEIAKALGRSP